MFGGGAEAARLLISLAVTSGPAMKALGDVQGKMAEIGRGVKAAFGQPFQQAFTAFGNIGDAADGMRSVAGAVQKVVGAMVGGAAKMETFGLQFEVLLGSADKAKARMADLAQFANTTPFELPGVVEASRLLQTFTDGALAAGDGLRMVGDVAAGTGKPIEDVAFKIGRMYDALRSGTNIGESLMYLQEMGAISGSSRRKIEELAKAVQSGGMTMEDAWKAASGEFGKFGGMTKKLAASTEGRLSTAIDAVNMTLAKLGEKLLPIVNQALSAVVPIMDAFSFAAEKASQYWYVLAPFVLGAAKAFMVYARNAFFAAGATTALGASARVLWKAVLGPVGLIIAGLELLFLAFDTNFMGIRDIVDGVVKWIRENFGWLIDGISSVAGVLGTLVGGIVSAVGDTFTKMRTIGAAADPFKPVVDSAEAAAVGVAASTSTMRDNWNYGTVTGWVKPMWWDQTADQIAAYGPAINASANAALSGQNAAAKYQAALMHATIKQSYADSVAEIIRGREAIKEAASGALSTAAAEQIISGSISIGKLDLSKQKTDLAASEQLYKDYSAKVLTAKQKAFLEQEGVTRSAYLKELQLQIATQKNQLDQANLDQALRLVDLAMYGDATTRLLRLKAVESMIAYGGALESQDEMVKGKARVALEGVRAEIRGLEAKMPGWGYNAMSDYGTGMVGATGVITKAAARALSGAARFLIAESPPKDPRNPLHKIGEWGYRTGSAWADSFSGGLQTADLGSAMKSPPVAAAISGAGGGAGSGASSSPGGGSVSLQIHFSSVVPYTPAEQTELGRRVGPAVYDYLRGRGAV